MKKIIRFTASWCIPCKQFAPIFDRVASNPEFSEWEFSVVDIEEDFESAQKWNVRSIPTTIAFIDDSPVERIVGVISQESLEEKIKKCN